MVAAKRRLHYSVITIPQSQIFQILSVQTLAEMEILIAGKHLHLGIANRKTEIIKVNSKNKILMISLIAFKTKMKFRISVGPRATTLRSSIMTQKSLI